MAYESYFEDDIPDFIREAEEIVEEREALAAQPAEVTIKFGKGLVGEPFTSKNGKELVEVSIPNPDKADTRPWETFVISPKMIHDNQFGKGVWMKLPEDGATRLYRSTKTGIDDIGKPIWLRETREVPNTELKALMESYKHKSIGSVLSDLSDRKEETAAAKPSGKTSKKQETARYGGKMASFVYTGEEYINADHIISIDASTGTATIWIRLDTGDKYARRAKYLKEILETLGCRKAEQNE